MSKIQKIIVSIILCALVFLAGAGAYIYYTDAKEKAAYERAERLEKERKVKRLATLEENFEAFLNGFVDEVAKDVRQYKQSRALIKGLIDLDGLSSPREIEQNFKLVNRGRQRRGDGCGYFGQSHAPVFHNALWR